MVRMAIVTAHRGASCAAECMVSWGGRVPLLVQAGKRGVLPAFQSGLEAARENGIDLLAHFHDDLVLNDDPLWPEYVMAEFLDPLVGIVGFGGALGHGTPDLYTSPYHLPNLARQHFMSNMLNAEQHGSRFTGACDVAVVDGFALIIRRSILEKVGGWPTDRPVGYFMYSEWACCEARRQGYRIRLLGIACDHLGGRTSSIINVTDDYQEAHRYFYETNRDVMPFRVKG